jgi:hypothetical protein
VKAPPPPVITIDLHDAPNGVTKCASSDGKKCPGTPIAETDNWIMLRPREWQKVQNYNDLLVCIIAGGCKETKGSRELTVKDLQNYVQSLKRTVHTLRVR